MRQTFVSFGELSSLNVLDYYALCESALEEIDIPGSVEELCLNCFGCASVFHVLHFARCHSGELVMEYSRNLV